LLQVYGNSGTYLDYTALAAEVAREQRRLAGLEAVLDGAGLDRQPIQFPAASLQGQIVRPRQRHGIEDLGADQGQTGQALGRQPIALGILVVEA
jgi:hypothetical protein